jgi:peptidoglycan/xylan/chitin deacetylase (PgdA/CDA1 family)/GT2 family glycosyltransferase
VLVLEDRCLPLVSIVIPALNAAATLGETLASVVGQKCKNWEAVVVDDGSVDRTAEVIYEFSARDARIRSVRQDTAGLAAARNRGIAESVGSLLLFLDAGDRIAPNHLTNLVAAIGAQADIVAYSGYVRVNEEGVPFATVFDPSIGAQPFPAFGWRNKLAVHAVMVPRSLIDEVGGFDPTLPSCEDWDMWLRLARRGNRFIGTSEPTALHHTSRSSTSCNFVRLAAGAAEVLARARKSDRRVIREAIEHREGLEDAVEVPLAHFVLWSAAAAAACCGDIPSDLLALPRADLGGQAAALSETMHEAISIGSQLREGEVGRIWVAVEPVLRPMIEAIEGMSSEAGLAHRIVYELERALLRSDALLTPLQLTLMRGERARIDKLPNWAPPGDLLHLRVYDGGDEVFRAEIPCWGALTAHDVARQLAREVGEAGLAKMRHGKIGWISVIARMLRARSLPSRRKIRLLGWLPRYGGLSGSAATRARFAAKVAAEVEELTMLGIDVSSREGDPGGDSKECLERFFDGPYPWQLFDAFEQRKYRYALDVLAGKNFENALEIGCAEGHFTQLLAPNIHRLLAVEISAKAIERAQIRCSEYNNVAFECHDFFHEGGRARFNLVLCSEVLYCMPDEAALRQAAVRLRDALAPGGMLLTIHSFQVNDEPELTGFDWGFPFGAAKMAEVLAAVEGLYLVETVRTQLYRIDLWRADPPVAPEPKIRHVDAGMPRPAISRTIRWGGVVARAEDLCRNSTTRTLPILMYHMVADDGPSKLNRYRIGVARFRQQIEFLRRHGFYTVTSSKLNWFRQRGEPLLGRPVMLTFDDGYRDFYENAWPVLDMNGFDADVFIVTGKVGGTSDWDRRFGAPQPLMTWEEIAELAGRGIAFGSHLVTHRHVDSLSTTELFDEALRSRLTLERKLGKKVHAIAAPSGGLDERAIRIFDAAGYHLCYSTRSGIASIDLNPLNLPRIEITGDMAMDSFALSLGLS